MDTFPIWQVPKGEPANWPSDAEHRAKFDSLVRPSLSAARADALADALWTLDRQPSIPHVLALSCEPLGGKGGTA